MKISLIAAMAKNRVIGKNNQMPWHLPADLAHFKKLTMHKPIIMGRKTFESIGRALPGRRNIVLSRQINFTAGNCEVYASLEEALVALNDAEEVIIIGGETLFKQALPLANKMHLTYIDIEVDGDTFFPSWNKTEWHEISVSSHRADEKNPYNYQFIELNKC